MVWNSATVTNDATVFEAALDEPLPRTLIQEYTIELRITGR